MKQPETPALTERKETKLIRRHGHFIDSDRRGNCSFCGGRPGSAAVRLPDEQGTQGKQAKRRSQERKPDDDGRDRETERKEKK